jgi:hypothetical protein
VADEKSKKTRASRNGRHDDDNNNDNNEDPARRFPDADPGHSGETLIRINPRGCSLGRKSVAAVRLLAPVGGVLTLQSVGRDAGM